MVFPKRQQQSTSQFQRQDTHTLTQMTWWAKCPGRDSNDPVICPVIYSSLLSFLLIGKEVGEGKKKLWSIHYAPDQQQMSNCSCMETGPLLCNADTSKNFTQLHWHRGTTLLGHMLSPYVYYQNHLLLLQFCGSSIYSLAKPLTNEKAPVMIPFHIVTEQKWWKNSDVMCRSL